jgi:hypothetical protein
MNNNLVVISINQEEALVWKTGVAPRTKPESISAPEEGEHRHRRMGDHQMGHDKGQSDPIFFEAVTNSIKGAGEILLIGHGKGKASTMLRLVQYWERKHPELAHKVVDALDTDLERLSENEILALARDWFDTRLI